MEQLRRYLAAGSIAAVLAIGTGVALASSGSHSGGDDQTAVAAQSADTTGPTGDTGPTEEPANPPEKRQHKRHHQKRHPC